MDNREATTSYVGDNLTHRDPALPWHTIQIYNFPNKGFCVRDNPPPPLGGLCISLIVDLAIARRADMTSEKPYAEYTVEGCKNL